MARSNTYNPAGSKRCFPSPRKSYTGAFPWTSRIEKATYFLEARKAYETEYQASFKDRSSKPREPTRPEVRRTGLPFDSENCYRITASQKAAQVKDTLEKEAVVIGTPLLTTAPVAERQTEGKRENKASGGTSQQSEGKRGGEEQSGTPSSPSQPPPGTCISSHPTPSKCPSPSHSRSPTAQSPTAQSPTAQSPTAQSPTEQPSTDNVPRPFGGVHSVYRKDFTDYSKKFKAYYKVKSAKPEEVFIPPKIKFQGESIYKTSFKLFEPLSFETCRQPSAKPKHEDTKARTVRTEPGQDNHYISITKQDFTSPASKERLLAGSKDSDPSDSSRSDSNTVKKESNPVTESVVRSTGPPTRVSNKPKTPFTYRTMYMADFKDFGAVETRKQCKPPEQGLDLLNEIPLEGQTTPSAWQPKWPPQPRGTMLWEKGNDYIKSYGKLKFNSMYSMDYTNPGAVTKTAMCMPVPRKETILSEGAPAPMETTYNATYRSWKEVPPSLSCKPQYAGKNIAQKTGVQRNLENWGNHRQENSSTKLTAGYITTYNDSYTPENRSIPRPTHNLYTS